MRGGRPGRFPRRTQGPKNSEQKEFYRTAEEYGLAILKDIEEGRGLDTILSIHICGCFDKGLQEFQIFFVVAGSSAGRLVGDLGTNFKTIHPLSLRFEYQNWSQPWTDIGMRGEADYLMLAGFARKVLKSWFNTLLKLQSKSP